MTYDPSSSDARDLISNVHAPEAAYSGHGAPAIELAKEEAEEVGSATQAFDQSAELSLRERLAASVILPPLGGLAAAALAIYGLSRIGLSWPCPFLHLTGWQCPVCGATRAFGALLHGDLTAAWRHNQLIILIAILLTVLVIVDLWRVLSAANRAVLTRRPPTSWRKTFDWGLLAAAVAFTIWRNIF